jgi:hypothetical protein
MSTPDRDAVLAYLARCVRDRILSEPQAVSILKRFDRGEDVFPMGLPLAPEERTPGTTAREILGGLQDGEVPEL